MINYDTADQPQVERTRPSSDLVIDVRFRKFVCGLALVPWLYRFLCILWDGKIQPVYASSSAINPWVSVMA
jgi:hypothetical protein